MIEVEAAQALLRQALAKQTKTETLPLLNASGRVTAEAITAPVAVPSFPRSGMDGYAVYAADLVGASQATPVSLPVAGTLYAGDDPTGLTGKRQTAYRVMTGAAIPTGFDTVVKQELTDQGSQCVAFYTTPVAGSNYGAIGEDIQLGQAILPANFRLTSAALGILASLGIKEVSVLKKIRVGLIATGSELAPLGQSLLPGQIYNSTSYTVAAAITQFGGEVVFQTVCPDDPIAFQKIVQSYAGQVDLVITTGGVSVGEKDFIPQGLALLKAEELFHYVNLKPGTPVMAAKWQESVILSLSGNPFAAFVNFQLFYWDLVAHFYHCEAFALKEKWGTVVSGEMEAGRIRRFIRATYTDGRIQIAPRGHRSAIFHTTIATNCLVEQPVGEKIQPGSIVKVYLWPE